MPDVDAEILAELANNKLVTSTQVGIQTLAGGVSCDVWKIEGVDRPLVVKKPLEKLRVEADWRASIARGDAEIAWLKRVHGMDARLVPEIVAVLPESGAFVMRYVPDGKVWKDELMARRTDHEFAAEVGRALVRIHSETAGNRADMKTFATQENFRQLRTEPFLLHLQASHPDLADLLARLAERLLDSRIALMHGDISPKNILVTANGPVFLDAECAAYGDPAFDLAFCQTHLLLKTVFLEDDAPLDSARNLAAAYRAGNDWEDGDALDRRAGELTSALLVARIDGKSPAPYLVDAGQREHVRSTARRLLHDGFSLGEILETWGGNYR